MTNFGVELNLMTTPEQKIITPKYPFISTVLAADFLCNQMKGPKSHEQRKEPKTRHSDIWKIKRQYGLRIVLFSDRG
jgi:hypothetical protein